MSNSTSRTPYSNDTSYLSSSQVSSISYSYTASNAYEATKCWESWDAFTDCPKTTSTVSIYTPSFTYNYTSYSTFKLCDGHPRALAHGHWRTSRQTVSDITYPFQTITRETLTYEYPPSGIPVATVTTVNTSPVTQLGITCAKTWSQPRCTIDDVQCQQLFSAWTAGGFTRSKPPCYYPGPTAACRNCALYVPTVKLLYFPVTMTGDFCGDNYHTVTPNHNSSFSTPSTIVWSGTTLTSGTAYLSYAGVTALADGARTCGPTRPAGILPLPSSSISSYRGHAAAMPILGDQQWPFNFADLAPNPVPWDAWISQEFCYTDQETASCATITQAAYRPFLVYPKEFFEMEEEWKHCGSGAFGIMDPPTALPKADVLAAPTMSSTVSGGESPGRSVSMRAGVSAGPRTPVPSPKATSHTTPQDTDPQRTTITDTRSMKTKDPIAATLSASGVNHDPNGAPQPLETSEPSGRSAATMTGPRAVTTIALGENTLKPSTPSIGTLPITFASDPSLISIGTNLMSQGEKTRLGNTFISVGTRSIVVSVQPTATSAGTEPWNALSVLSAAQTTLRPWAKLTLQDQTLTVYSGGEVVGAETIYAPGHSQITISGEAISFVSDGVVIGVSSKVVYAAPTTTTDHHISLTFQHGMSHTTITGAINSAGSTVLSIGTSRITFIGQTMTIYGTAFSVPSRSASRTADAVSSLPQIVTASPTSQSATLPPIVDATSGHASSATAADQSSTSESVKVSLRGFIYHVTLAVVWWLAT